MNTDDGKEFLNLPALRDFELDAEELGPSTRMMRIEADPEGGILYQFGRRQARCLQLPTSHGLRTFGMIDQTHMALFLNDKTNALEALASFDGAGTHVTLFGPDWGCWLDADGRRHNAPDIVSLLRQWRVPVTLQEFKQHLMFDFTINIFARQCFHGEMRCFFREDRSLRHSIGFIFHYPDGRFVTSRLMTHDVATGKLRYIYDVVQFPLIWPPSRAALHEHDEEESDREESSAPKTGGAAEARQGSEPQSESAKPIREEASSRMRRMQEPAKRPDKSVLRPDDRSNGGRRRLQPFAPRPAPATSKPEGDNPAVGRRSRSTVPETTHLPIHELIGLLSTEENPDRRWIMIEPNLAMGRPERTYALISQHSDLIADRVRDWLPTRLKAVFTDQPGTVMIGLMLHWKINQVLAVADTNAESDRILDWLRGREIDRLLKMEFTREVSSVNAARRVLNLDSSADSAAIKKTWRTLLGFLNADLGRAAEHAIHRKKDEIAKHLHEARDVLMKKLG